MIEWLMAARPGRRGGPRDVDALVRRRLCLLESIDTSGSITAAAKSVGLSYKAAWQAVDALNALSQKPLVARAAGGSGGGGTRLTPEGRALVAAFRKVDTERLRFLRGLGGRAGDLAPVLGWLRRLSMRTSARNQFFGRVSSARRGAVNSEVVLKLSGGDAMTAVITNESLDDLGLRKGAEAFALVKASWVVLAVGDKPRVSARNVFAAKVERLLEGAVNTEAFLRLPGGTGLIAVLTRESVRDLALAPGRACWAIVNASSVIVGVQQ